MNVLFKRVTEVMASVLPIVVFVLILHFTITPVSGVHIARFVTGAAAIVLGLAIFLYGIDMGILPFGANMGASFPKSGKLRYVIIAGFILGFFVNAAEPDLRILASQVDSITGNAVSALAVLIIVSAGTGIMLALGITKIVFNLPLYKVIAVIYGLILIFALFASSDMLAIAFDASGATTGALTVPLVLALSAGVSAMKKVGKTSEEDSFGLVGVMSAGAVLGVLIMNIFIKTDGITGVLGINNVNDNSILGPFISDLPGIAAESFIALLPMVIMLLIFQKINFRLPRRSFHKILRGFLYAYIGLVLFLSGVSAGFMDVASIVSYKLASFDSKVPLVCLGFILGMLTILTEPAVYVLTRQIEIVTSGQIKKRAVLITLAVGVAFAVGLAMLKIVIPEITLWHFLLPGYLISIVLMFFVPKIFVGIAFDSGGVASGPMTTTFILAFAQGASDAIVHADILLDSFGVIAMVAMTPIIALQALGLIYKLKAKNGVDINIFYEKSCA